MSIQNATWAFLILTVVFYTASPRRFKLHYGRGITAICAAVYALASVLIYWVVILIWRALLGDFG